MDHARVRRHARAGGWQWLFLLEALPSVLLGFAVLRWLPNNIESAQWLNADEKHALRANLDADPSGNKSHALGKAFSDPKVWALGLIDLCVLLGLYAVSFWLPTILRDTGVKDAYHIGWLMVIPNAAAVLATLYCGASSDRARERRWHIVVPFMVSAVALAIAASSSHGTFGTVLLFSLINAGAAAAMPVVWALPSTFLKGSAAAGGSRSRARSPTSADSAALHRLAARHVPFAKRGAVRFRRVHGGRLRSRARLSGS